MVLYSMDEHVELLFGCYEQILFGYRVTPDGEQWTATVDFINHSHTASLSVVAVNNRFVATGSKDETIHIYDIKKKVEHGSLLHHNDPCILSTSSGSVDYDEPHFFEI
ncbi:p21-activated protein kinase-interacting protein 1-like [Hyla sarda]|uniref:p21-activated protein kinase-interacting protein 1-like n=1 Tax=Hyla sarda TaxID=327740 RepID=UPI0024C3D745|nr:p21-activated protein kinase-interacting protein 1-like [Hyla sarda]